MATATRSRLNLKEQNITELLLNNIPNHGIAQTVKKRYATRSKVNLSDAKLGNLLLKDEIDEAIEEWEKKESYNWLVLDVEAYSLNTNLGKGSLDMIPVQIAWDVTNYSLVDHERHEEKCVKMFYVAEALALSKYRNMLNYHSSYFTPKTLQKHERHLIRSNFSIRSAADILKELKQDLKECDIFSAFNMEWDIKALKNLCKMATTQSPEERIQLYPLLKDPTRVVQLEKVDIMIMGYLVFKKRLKDNTSENSGGGSYTVSNMYKTLCGERRQDIEAHLAENDVVMEKNILMEILKYFEDPSQFHTFMNNHDLRIPQWSKKPHKNKTII